MLVHEDTPDPFWHYIADHLSFGVAALGPQGVFQFWIAVEVVLNGALVAARHEEKRVDPCAMASSPAYV